VITLGLKNQFGFVSHRDRKKHHGVGLHGLLADLYAYIRPDLTVIDATEAVCGQLPLESLSGSLVERLDLLIGGRTRSLSTRRAPISWDMHRRCPPPPARPREGAGRGDLARIAYEGEDPAPYPRKIGWGMPDLFPDDVKVVRGGRKVCGKGAT